MKQQTRNRWVASAAATFAILVSAAATPTTAAGAQGDCGQPISSGDAPTSTDCLFILNAALGLNTCNPECVCELNNAPPITSTDALVCLNVAIGNPPPFFPSCPCDAPSSTTSSTMLTTTITSSSTTTTTSTTTTSTTSTSSTTLTTLPPPASCAGAQGNTCDGVCPNDNDACLPSNSGDGCTCMPMGCGGYMGDPQCYGLCPPEQLCIDDQGTCTCEIGQQACEGPDGASPPQCDGLCPPGAFCIQLGEACGCAPVTCGQFAPAPTCLGSCPSAGQVCVTNGEVCECQMQ